MPATDTQPQPVQALVCPACHQGVKPEYYFCPNCGAELHQPPLSTTPLTQLGIYAFSIVLPMIGFIFVTRWKGMKYYRSEDPQARMIGQVAWVLIILSTLFTIWYLYNWTQLAIQSSVDSINADMSI